MRVNPDEVHFDDSEFIDTLFPLSGRKTNKLITMGKREEVRRQTPLVSSAPM